MVYRILVGHLFYKSFIKDAASSVLTNHKDHELVLDQDSYTYHD